MMLRIGRGRSHRRQPLAPGIRGGAELRPGRDRGGGWSGQPPGGAPAPGGAWLPLAPAAAYCRTWYCPPAWPGSAVPAAPAWLTGILTVGSPAPESPAAG